MTSATLKRVLVVDDDPDVQTIIRSSLEVFGGLTVTVCDSAEDALQVLDSEAPDLILLDWAITGLQGAAAIAQFRAKPGRDGLPVAIISGVTDPRQIEEMRRTGANEVISKPFDPLTLSTTLIEIHDRALGASP